MLRLYYCPTRPGLIMLTGRGDAIQFSGGHFATPDERIQTFIEGSVKFQRGLIRILNEGEVPRDKPMSTIREKRAEEIAPSPGDVDPSFAAEVEAMMKKAGERKAPAPPVQPQSNGSPPKPIITMTKVELEDYAKSIGIEPARTRQGTLKIVAAALREEE